MRKRVQLEKWVELAGEVDPLSCAGDDDQDEDYEVDDEKDTRTALTSLSPETGSTKMGNKTMKPKRGEVRKPK